MLAQILEEEVFPRVQRPARYLGNEWNAVKKNWEEVEVRMAFAFPDMYEVGMSHLGTQILYGLVNAQPHYLMERIFAPAPDLEMELRRRNLPLFSLESRRPLADFDVLGFTLQYELNFTNILNILDLAGIPLFARARSGRHPLVIGGGPLAFNPEPIAAFFDCFVLGDGEEVLLEILEVVRRSLREGWREDRERLLAELAGVPGVYVPEFYEVSYRPDGRIAGITPVHPAAPARVKKRFVKDLDRAYFPLSPVVPWAEAVHERAMVELFRGCSRGCRFCQAGAIYRPVRERSPEVLASHASSILGATGYEELSLTSLSSFDYTRLEQLLSFLRGTCEEQRARLSFPSLRLDSFSVRLARDLPGGKRASLTFAPEAGTQRLRDVINKGVTEEEILEAVTTAFGLGWRAVKLYFMLGLPTETEEDLEGIAELVAKVVRRGRGVLGAKPRVKVSAASFVPKPHTPFQWEGQDPREVLEEKHKFLRGRVRKAGGEYDWHNVEMSFLEAVFARGDRRLAPVLLKAWELGCRFDGWSEHFRFSLWEEAFRACGVEGRFYAERSLEYDEVLPWEHLDPGVTKEFLAREHQRALAGIRTPDCRFGECSGCGVCSRLGVSPSLAGWRNG